MSYQTGGNSAATWRDDRPCGRSASAFARTRSPTSNRLKVPSSIKPCRPRKKVLPSVEQDRPDLKAARVAWREEFAGIDPSRLVFLDESGATTAMNRDTAAPRAAGGSTRWYRMAIRRQSP